MKKIKKTNYFSWRIGKLPKGCKQCVKGSKTVLFITGLCPRHCDYCPISDQKYGKDVVYANEWKTDKINDLFKEIELCNSKGVGITGGDPLARLERTTDYIKKLKQRFGKRFHTHLYTSLDLVTKSTLKRLFDSGLDEIRFHPDIDDYKLWNRIELAKQFDWDVGVEIPIIPGKEIDIKELIDFLDKKIDFLNMNELELSDANANKLSELGFMSKDGISYGVEGVELLAKKLLVYCKNKSFNVHYCTAKLKDRVQLAKRIKKRAKNISRKYDIITPDGTLLRGAIYTTQIYPSAGYQRKLDAVSVDKRKKIVKELVFLREYLIKTYKLSAKLLEIDNERLRILTSKKIIKTISKELKKKGFQPAIIEEYPTHDSFIVEIDIL